MFEVTLLLALAAAPQDFLPPRLGGFARLDITPLGVARAERELYAEYGLVAAYRAEYLDDHTRMVVEAFRFTDVEGAHAAYLCARPAGGVSPMIWQINAVTGDGMTVMEFGNYMLRFRGALPTVSSALEEMLTALPELAGDTVPWDLNGRYLDILSTRAILGPVSLHRFAKRIPPSAAGFRLGAKGRMARFQTPAGAMTEVVFEYPTEDIAKDRAKVLAMLPGSLVRVDRTCAGVIFDPVDLIVADELLGDTPFCGPVTWDANLAWDRPMTVDEGMRGTAFGGFIFGALLAGLRRLQRGGEPFPNRMIFLRL